MSTLALLSFLLVPVLLALVSSRHPFGARFSRRRFRIGSLIVYQVEKASPHPEPGAFDIQPSPRGELYYYSIRNYFRMIDRIGDGRIISVGPDRTRYQFRTDDSHLRPATLIERLLLRPRLPRS